jgi:protein gp37
MQNLDIPPGDQFPKVYAVALGSDLFHESVSIGDLKRIFKVMNNSRHHVFELLTKRIERAFCASMGLNWTPNILMGVAIESGEYGWRIDYLRRIPASYKYLSVCPILGPFPNVDLTGVDRVGVVEETWGLKRPAKQEWIDQLEKQCGKQNVGFSLNDGYQWGAN